MAYIPCKIGGGTEKPILLWTNPNPSTSFEAQTVSIDMTNYQSIIIKTVGVRGDTTYTKQYINKNDSNIKMVATYSGSGASIRSITNISDNGITFGNGQIVGGSASSLYCIPIEIYGLKKALI